MITQIRGILKSVGEEELAIEINAFEFEVLIPEVVRRQIQGRVGELIALYTIFYIEGNTMGGRMTPRLVGFQTTIDREFFDVFCSVDGVGVKKALRAMVVPVRDLARTIQDQDVRTLATYPGIGEATAERIVAKLRRKVGKFALIINRVDDSTTAGASNGRSAQAEPDVIRDTFAALLSVGHNESQARQAMDRVLSGKKKFKSVAEMIDAIYMQERDEPTPGAKD